MKLCLLTLSILVITVLKASAQDVPKGTPVAIIDKIKGDVTLFSGPSSHKKLDPQRDRAKPLYEDDSLQCASGSSVTGSLTNFLGWRKSAEQDLCHVGKLAAALGNVSGRNNPLMSYGARAGRNKGEDVPIFAPPDHGAVLAESFVIRWRTRPPLDTFTAILEDSHGAELGRVADVSGTEGVLQSDALRSALVRYAGSSGDHMAKLTFHDKADPDQSVTFTVLTPAQEADLNRRLEEDTRQAGLFHYVERAAVFDSFQLYGEVAVEYDAALKEAPESRDLLQAAFNAYSRIGDFRTARSLRDRLEQVEGDQ